jgi:hypothetical protein
VNDVEREKGNDYECRIGKENPKRSRIAHALLKLMM